MIGAEKASIEPGTDDLARGGEALVSVANGIMEAARLSELISDLSKSDVLSPEQVRAGLDTIVLMMGGLTPSLRTLNELLSKLRAFHARPAGARSLNS